MADDPRYRPQRPDPYAQGRTSRPGAAPQDDPLAELARLIGQDEAFIAASRQGTRPRQHDPRPEPDTNASAPNWLGRAGRRLGKGAEPGWREPGSREDAEFDAGQRTRQAARWDAEPEQEPEQREGAFGDPERDARHDWHEPRYDPRREEQDPYRLAAPERPHDRLAGEEEYAEGDPVSEMDPFEPRYARIHESADEEEHGSRLRRRGGILTIAAVLGLAAVGTAAAFGYRAWNSGSNAAAQPPLIKADTAPAKVVPAQAGDGQQNKLIYDRIGEKIQGSNDKMVSREEQPIELRDMTRQPAPRGLLPPPGTPGTVSIGAQPPAYATPPPIGGNSGPDEPKRVHTIPIRPDQVSTLPGPGESGPMPGRSVPTTNLGPAAAPPAQAARPAPALPAPPRPLPAKPAASAPLSLGSPAEPPPASPRSGAASAQPAYRTAALPPAGEAGNYVVQISSQRSEADAQASFRALQAKYPGVLGSRQPVIRRADLGSKGVYYRAQVGPFATAEDANQLCSNLKAAGGQCIVQHN